MYERGNQWSVIFKVPMEKTEVYVKIFCKHLTDLMIKKKSYHVLQLLFIYLFIYYFLDLLSAFKPLTGHPRHVTVFIKHT